MHAATYSQGSQAANDANPKRAVVDDVAFIQFTLSQAGLTDAKIVDALYGARDRMSPASRAWVAFILNKINPADPRAHDLISNLETSAIITSSSAHWETPSADIFTRGSEIYTTSVVVYVLAQV